MPNKKKASAHSLMSENLFDDDVTDLIAAISLLRRRVQEVVLPKELSWTQITVVARLARDGPATTSDLARSERMKPQSMGALIAELEEMGLVKRRPHPSDKRQMLIELTVDGIKAQKAVRAEKIIWLSQAVAKLSNAERTILFSAAEIMKSIVENN